MFQYPAHEAISPFLQFMSCDALRLKARYLLEKAHLMISASDATDDSLSSGSLGAVLYYYYRYEVFDQPGDANSAHELLGNILRKINSHQSGLFNPSFAGGLSGLGYLLNHLSQKGFVDFSMKSAFSEIDDYLFRQAVVQIEHGNTDYLHGAFGIIFYFLSRCEEQVLRGYTGILLDTVLTKAEAQRNCPLIGNFIKHQDPNRINLGLSHGQAGFLLILIQALRHGFQEERLSVYIKNAIGQILHYQTGHKGNSCASFPFEIFLDSSVTDIITNRLGWCYGDLNQVLLLYEAARILGESSYTTVADSVGMMSVTRVTETDTLCFDSHFCHGSSGLAQVYRKMYELRKLPAYQDAYLFWVNKTTEFLERDLDTGLYKGKEAAFLEGLIGPAIVLLSFASEEPSDWSKCWLL
jgi:lantibiotic modifying enzyme